MTRDDILSEIRRTAEANGGVPLGFRRFESETGIERTYWSGKHWARWGDAVREAGYEPNAISEAYDGDALLEHLAMLTAELGRVPTWADLRFKRGQDEGFPSDKTFRKLGSKTERAERVIQFCEEHPGNEETKRLWSAVLTTIPERVEEETADSNQTVGYVYLVQHGSRQEYKIGRTENPLRREGEIALQLPDKLQPIHHIQTDDPAGVENYWHRRFADKRKQGEWFALNAADVRAFRRWKRIF